MYYGYCFTAVDGWHTPKVQLQTPEEVLAYCRLQHNLFPEVRITDEDDFCVLQVVDHAMYCPLQDGTFSKLDLLSGESRILTRPEVDEETRG